MLRTVSHVHHQHKLHILNPGPDTHFYALHSWLDVPIRRTLHKGNSIKQPILYRWSDWLDRHGRWCPVIPGKQRMRLLCHPTNNICHLFMAYKICNPHLIWWSLLPSSRPTGFIRRLSIIVPCCGPAVRLSVHIPCNIFVRWPGSTASDLFMFVFRPQALSINIYSGHVRPGWHCVVLIRIMVYDCSEIKISQFHSIKLPVRLYNVRCLCVCT